MGRHLSQANSYNRSAKISWRSAFSVAAPTSEMDIHSSDTLLYVHTFTHAYTLTLKRPHTAPPACTCMLQCINLFHIFLPLPGLNLNWKVYGKIIRLWDCQKSTNHVSPLGPGSCTIITAKKSSGCDYFLKMFLRFGHILYSF